MGHGKDTPGYLVSQKAVIGNPIDNKDYRCNPSLLVRFNKGKEGPHGEATVIIDAGKTFRESVIRWFPKYNIRQVDAIILTHGHADAIFGYLSVVMIDYLQLFYG